MRDIKFRAKRIKVDEWVYGYLDYDEESEIHTVDGWKIDKNTVGEFTGLYDLIGLPVYEGDIIKYVDEFEGEKSYGIVTFGTYDLGCNMGEYQYVVHGWYALLIPGSEDELMRSEILTKEMIEGNVTIEGNRWDNPELLKEDE